MISVELPVPLNAWLQAFISWVPLSIFRLLDLPLRFAPAALPLMVANFAEPLPATGPTTFINNGRMVPVAAPVPVGPTCTARLNIPDGRGFVDLIVWGRATDRPVSEPVELKRFRVPDRFSAVALPLMWVLLLPSPLSVITLVVFVVPVEQLPVSALDQAGLTHEAGESAIVGIAQ